MNMEELKREKMTESSIFADLETIKANMIKLQKRNEELEAENAKLKSAVAWQKETIAARDATIGSLEAALRPFARYADALDLDEIQNTAKIRYGELSPGIIALHFRRARAALEPKRTEADIVGKEEGENERR